MDAQDSVGGPGAISSAAGEDVPARSSELTVRQKILMAAVAMGAGTETENFSVEDLIVRSWKMFPESFSLRGFERLYPDSNRVQAKLAGADGLCGLGWLEHTDQRTYQVTRKGRTVARALAGDGTSSGRPKKRSVEPSVAQLDGDGPVERVGVTVPSRLPTATTRPHEDGDEGGDDGVKPPPGIQRVFVGTGKAHAARKSAVVTKSAVQPKGISAPVESAGQAPTYPGALTPAEVQHVQGFVKVDALRKFLRGQPLTLADACKFWGFGVSAPAETVEQRLRLAVEVLKRSVESFTEGVDSRLPPLSTCYGLFNLNRLMAEKFARELEGLQGRR